MDGSRLEADLEIQLRHTGYDVDVLVLKMTPTEPRPGLRWIIVASGQYRTATEMELNAFCPIGGQAYVEDVDTIRCEDREFGGSDDVRYDFGDGIGYVDEGVVRHATEGLVDFDPTSSTVISGRLNSGDRAGEPTFIWIPVERVEGARSGATTHLALPGIGGGYLPAGAYGDPVRGIADGYEESKAQLATLAEGLPLLGFRPSELSFSLRFRPGPGRLDWATPETDTPEMLAWTTSEGWLPPLAFSLWDPFGEADLTRRTFLTGVLATITVGLSLLLLEGLLTRLRWGGTQ